MQYISHPNVKLNKDSIFNCFLFDKECEFLISKNHFKNYLRNLNKFRDFLSLNANKIVKAAFVFQVQLYNPSIDLFLFFVFYYVQKMNALNKLAF